MVTSRISKRHLIIAFPIGMIIGFLIGGLMHGFGLFVDTSGNASVPVRVSRLSTYRIPDSLNFCGEAMPLGVTDVRERMEQAFYTELSDAQIILDLKRSTKYFPYIEKELDEMGLPVDLKYLPVAESALRNLVSSRGAAGIWQFTRSTARKYGLKVNYYVDERFNFEKSTDAALRYLSDLHSMFGSWTLAAAAYNMGQNGIRATTRYQMADNYYDLHLNDETSRFVFRIVALKQIMSHYKMYGFELRKQDFYKPVEIRTVDVGRVRNLATWATEEGTSYKEVKYLNPWMTGHLLPYGAWTVALPRTAAPPSLASRTAADSALSPDSSKTYVVKRGDSLTRIARDYGVTVSDLISWNGLRNRSFLTAGERLTIMIDDANSEP